MISNKSRKNSSLKIRKIVLTGLFSSLIYVFTAYLHIPTGSGYTHAGDGIIYLSASILPMPYAIASAVIGGVLADGLSGFAVWIPATFIVKALTTMCFTNKGDKILNKRNSLAVIPSFFLCVVGYGFYESIFMTKTLEMSTIIAGFYQTPSYCMQVGISYALYILLAKSLDKINFKSLIQI